MTMCKLALSKRCQVGSCCESERKWEQSEAGRKEMTFVGFTCDHIPAVCSTDPLLSYLRVCPLH